MNNNTERQKTKIQEQEKAIKRLMKYRIDNKLTISFLSDELNVPIDTLNAWMSGRRRPGTIAISMIEDFLSQH